MGMVTVNIKQTTVVAEASFAKGIYVGCAPLSANCLVSNLCSNMHEIRYSKVRNLVLV